MSFIREKTNKWSNEIPGARWFKADLHIHTIDDSAGGRAKMPKGLLGDPYDPDILSKYAKIFLQGLIAKGVQIVGLTPHSPRMEYNSQISAVWTIVDEWNNGNDDDDIPFREKIYAVFPGFEPNIKDGATGVHILFLFDPEIGKERFFQLFDAIMDGKSPWDKNSLQLTPRDATDAFATLDQRQSEDVQSASSWDYILLAPHFQGNHGYSS